MSLSGQGNIVLDVATIAVIFLAAIVQFAVYWDRTIRESSAVDAARILMCVGYLIIGTRWSFLFSNHNDLLISPIVLIGVFLTAVAQIVLAADRLMTDAWSDTEVQGQ